jgi:spoIIIJ-associated protein
MEWVETTGRTVEEAKDAALDQLGVDETDAEFVVVSEPKPGLFGRMRGEARVRARVMPTSPRPKRGRTRRSGPDQRRARGGQSRQAANTGGAVAVVEDAGDDTDREGGPGASGNGSGPSRADGGSNRNRRRRRPRGGSGRSGGGEPRAAGGASGAPAREAGNRSSRGREAKAATEEDESAMALSLEEQGESAREFIEGLVREMGLQADVSMRVVDETTAEVAVQGPELGILIGPGGATLGALQELTRTVVQKRTGGHSERILVDVAGYRAKRAEALQRFTRQVSEEVLSSGEERALEPMSAADRKVVHDTVNEIAGVQTRSEGEDPRRYIVISASVDADA